MVAVINKQVGGAVAGRKNTVVAAALCRGWSKVQGGPGAVGEGIPVQVHTATGVVQVTAYRYVARQGGAAIIDIKVGIRIGRDGTDGRKNRHGRSLTGIPPFDIVEIDLSHIAGGAFSIKTKGIYIGGIAQLAFAQVVTQQAAIYPKIKGIAGHALAGPVVYCTAAVVPHYTHRIGLVLHKRGTTDASAGPGAAAVAKVGADGARASEAKAQPGKNL